MSVEVADAMPTMHVEDEAPNVPRNAVKIRTRG